MAEKDQTETFNGETMRRTPSNELQGSRKNFLQKAAIGNWWNLKDNMIYNMGFGLGGATGFTLGSLAAAGLTAAGTAVAPALALPAIATLVGGAIGGGNTYFAENSNRAAAV